MRSTDFSRIARPKARQQFVIEKVTKQPTLETSDRRKPADRKDSTFTLRRVSEPHKVIRSSLSLPPVNKLKLFSVRGKQVSVKSKMPRYMGS